MKRSHVIYGVAAVSLLALNVWRWLPAQQDEAERAAPPRHALLATDDLTLRVAAVAAEVGPPRRDLFHDRAAPSRKTRPAVAKPVGPPPKSPEELAAEQAQAEFDSIKLIAIVFQDGVGQAFISLGGDSHIVSVGDAVNERFKVEAITEDAVDLRALDGSVGGRVALTGS